MEKLLDFKRLNITVYVTPVDNSEPWDVQFKGI
jgi:hypothetical protein